MLLDTDVLLDVAMAREFAAEGRAMLDWCHATPRSALVAWHTISNVYYLLKRGGPEIEARRFVSELLRIADVVSEGTAAVRQALTLQMGDFEDALQVAAAFAGDAQCIVTRNIADYRGSPVPALTPRSFFKRFGGA